MLILKLKRYVFIIFVLLISNYCFSGNDNDFTLRGIRPNPFFPYTDNEIINKIQFYYQNPGLENVSMKILKTNDDFISETLIHDDIKPINGKLIWDGRDMNGNLQSPGIYKYILMHDAHEIDGFLMLGKSGQIDHYKVYIGTSSNNDKLNINEAFDLNIIAKDFNNETVIVASDPYSLLNPEYSEVSFSNYIEIKVVLLNEDLESGLGNLSIKKVAIGNGIIKIKEFYDKAGIIRIQVNDDKGRVGISEIIDIQN
jgi:hypothetical protein